MHQCARFCGNPKISHENVVYQIIKCLLSTQHDKSRLNRSLNYFKRILFNPDPSKGLIVYVDSSFAGEWNKLSCSKPTPFMSRTVFVITDMGCPLYWLSKFQT